jgi:hypothetical protein
MTYGEATPTYNSGSRKIVNYKDFLQHDKEEEQELKDMKRKFKKNELEVGNQEHMSKYNKVTHKNDDMVEDEVDDSLEAFEESKSEEKTFSKEDVIKLIKKFNQSLPKTQGMTGEGINSWISKNL